MCTHKQLKENLQKNNLISPVDYIIACGSHGFTDLHFTNLDKKICTDSKYYISIAIENKPIILCHPNFYNLRQEIDEKMIKKEYFNGYDKKNNRVILHYKGDGKFRIGNKKGTNEFITHFDICDFHMLAKRKNYKYFIDSLSNKYKHRALQILLCELGISLGYKVKVAKNDLKPILTSKYSSEIKGNFLTIHDLELSHIRDGISLNNIDLIDVLWYDNNSHNIIAAFEVERSKNYDSVLRRLSCISSPSTYLICVGDDYFSFKNTVMNPVFFYWFKDKNLNYLTLDSLFLMLKDNEKYGKYLSSTLLLMENMLRIF